jgi:hypothetical protein
MGPPLDPPPPGRKPTRLVTPLSAREGMPHGIHGGIGDPGQRGAATEVARGRGAAVHRRQASPGRGVWSRHMFACLSFGQTITDVIARLDATVSRLRCIQNVALARSFDVCYKSRK